MTLTSCLKKKLRSHNQPATPHHDAVASSASSPSRCQPGTTQPWYRHTPGCSQAKPKQQEQIERQFPPQLRSCISRPKKSSRQSSKDENWKERSARVRACVRACGRVSVCVARAEPNRCVCCGKSGLFSVGLVCMRREVATSIQPCPPSEVGTCDVHRSWRREF